MKKCVVAARAQTLKGKPHAVAATALVLTLMGIHYSI